MMIDGDGDDDDDDESRMPALMAHASRLQRCMAAVSNRPVVHRCCEKSERPTARCSDI